MTELLSKLALDWANRKLSTAEVLEAAYDAGFYDGKAVG